MDADQLAAVDDWLDSNLPERFRREPLAQDWARVAKVIEELGEAVKELIAWTGQNPRKGQDDLARPRLLKELADTAITAILAIQHFEKDADATLEHVRARLDYLHWRIQALEA